jgi:hypothetical protein
VLALPSCGPGGPAPNAAPSTALSAALTGAPAPADPASVVATVNGVPITEAALAAHARATGLSVEAALDDLVATELLAARALERGLAADPDVVEAGRRAMVRRWLDLEFAPTVAPDRIPESDLRAVYEANKHWMNHDRLVMTIHILAPLDASAPPDFVEASRAALAALLGPAESLPRSCHRPCLDDDPCGARHLCVEAECAADADAPDWCASDDDCAAAAAVDPALDGSACEGGLCRAPCRDAAECGAGEGWTCRPTTDSFLRLAPPPPAAPPAPTAPAAARVALRPERIVNWYPPDATDLDPDFLRAAHALAAPGDVVGPVRSAFGWHLIMLVAEQPPVHLDFPAARALVTKRLLASFQKSRFQDLVKALAAEHAVTVDEPAVERALGGGAAGEPGTASAAPPTRGPAPGAAP